MLDLPKEFLAAVASRYDVKEAIGHGGMATIVLARDLRYDREVAMKVLLPEQSSSLSEDRFMREIKVLSRLSHPRILPLYDSGHAAGLLYYVMQLVEGRSLEQVLEGESRLEEDDVVEALYLVGLVRAVAGGDDGGAEERVVRVRGRDDGRGP